MTVDTRRETEYISRRFVEYQRTIGEHVVWFKFDTTMSRWDDVYDEGGHTYECGIHLPVLWVDQVEDPAQYSGEGRRPTQRMRFACSASDMRSRGIDTTEAHGMTVGIMDNRVPAPFPGQVGRPSATWYKDRLNDVAFYDGRFYAVSNFQIRGRTPGNDVIIGVSTLEMQEDEFSMDAFPWNTQWSEPFPCNNTRSCCCSKCGGS